MSTIAKEVTDATFAQMVVERSRTVPVVVDLWAPWCGPCRALAPVLERVAEQADGAFDLVKINVDDNPTTASRLGARSIPLVVAFKDGKPVSSFVGAQPESAVLRFVSTLLPSEADRMVADAVRARGQGRGADAERILETLLAGDPRHTQARLTLAELLGDDGRTDAALELLARAEPSPEVDRLRARLRLAHPDAADLDALRVQADSGDETAAVSLARALHGQGKTESALDVLLAAVRRQPAAKEGAARQAMLDLFSVLGSADPLVRRYRSALAQALF